MGWGPASGGVHAARRPARAGVRLHRGVRRLPWSLPPERPAGQNHRVRAHLSLRLAGNSRGRPAAVGRADIRQSCAGIRALQHALPDAQPLLRPMRPERTRRGLAGRAILVRACGAPAGQRRGAFGHRAVDRKGHCAPAQLRGIAHAIRPIVPRGRCRAYRAAHGSEGLESCGGGRQGAAPGDRRVLPGRRDAPDRGVFAAGAAAGLDGHALLMVVHDVAASLRRRSVCAGTAAGGTRLLVAIRRRAREPRRELRRYRSSCRSRRSRTFMAGRHWARLAFGSRRSRMAAKNSRSCSSIPFIDTSTLETSIGLFLPSSRSS